MAKRPAIMLYKGDCIRSKMSTCSLAAQGFWYRLLWIMDDSDECGVLLVNGKPMTNAQIARMTGANDAEVTALLDELKEANVYSIDPRGAIYSRRMVRDEAKRQSDANRQREYRSVTRASQDCHNDVTVSVTPLSEDESEDAKEVVVALEVQSPLDGACELIYADYPRKVGRPKAIEAIRKAIQRRMKAQHCGEEDAAQYIHQAVLEYARSPDGKRGEFVPYPATWFNQERFNDDRGEWYRSGDGKSSKAHQRTTNNLASIAAGFGFTSAEVGGSSRTLSHRTDSASDGLVERIAEFIDGE